MPLSDPGPRLLPSTLALHRASHLLNSRNLHPEPLPYPLPPSLHPPAPVELAEFDIDFILAGSLTQLGGDKKSKNAPIDMLNQPGVVKTPTLKLGPGGDDEDTFARFVGQFDDEYDDRRGEWTFRASAPPNGQQGSRTDQDSPRVEWESPGAGKYGLFANGEIRSAQQGRVWRVRKLSSREFELQEVKQASEIANRSLSSGYSAVKPTGTSLSNCYILACKLSHSELGGVKLPVSNRQILDSRDSISTATISAVPRLRVSISENIGTERAARLGSQDSAATAIPPSSQSVPLGSTRSSGKGGSISGEAPDALRERGRANIHFVGSRSLDRPETPKKKEKPVRALSSDHELDQKKNQRSFGGVFKRGLMASIKNTVAAHDEKKLLREERERERLQSQSWSPAGLVRPNDFIHPTGKTTVNPTIPDRSLSSLGAPKSSRPEIRSTTQKDNESWLVGLPGDVKRETPKLGNEEHEEPAWREGKAWHVVPDEAVAIVVPMEGDETLSLQDRAQAQSPFFQDGTRQALLVWYVPFNSEQEDSLSNAASRASSFSRRASDIAPTKPVVESSSSSMPKFQKLLRRQMSKERDTIKRDVLDGPLHTEPKDDIRSRAFCYAHPLPFRSFRVVARVVDVDDLRSEPDFPATPFEQWQEKHRSFSHDFVRAASSSSSNPSPSRPQPSLPSTDEMDTASSSTAPTSTIMAGRTFPTVIAVCHSRSQGVEFILEGLDRLGFCKGESAWGPTGYEEWRGSGLSDRGRELLDLLWAGCTGVMGLSGF